MGVLSRQLKPSGFKRQNDGGHRSWADKAMHVPNASDFDKVVIFEGVEGLEQASGKQTSTQYIELLTKIDNSLGKIAGKEHDAFNKGGYEGVKNARKEPGYKESMGTLFGQYASIQNILNDFNNHDTLRKQDPADLKHNLKQLEDVHSRLRSQGYFKGKRDFFDRIGPGSRKFSHKILSQYGLHDRINSGIPDIGGYDNENQLTTTIYHDNTAPLFYDSGYITSKPLNDGSGNPVDNLSIAEVRHLAIQHGHKVIRMPNKLKVKCSGEQALKGWLQVLQDASRKKRAVQKETNNTTPSLTSGSTPGVFSTPTAPPIPGTTDPIGTTEADRQLYPPPAGPGG